MNIIVTILYITAFINLGLAALVLWHNPKAETNKIFALTACSLTGWALTNALFQSTLYISQATLWANLSYVSVLITGASLLHFAWIYPVPQRQLKQGILSFRKWAVWMIAAVVSATPFVSGFIIDSVEITPIRRINTSSGIYFIAIFLFCSILGALQALLRSQQRTRGMERMQVRYVLTGMALTAFIGLTSNLILPLSGNYSLVWLGPASSIFFVGFIVYSIVAHQLFDIRLIIQRAVVYTLLLGLLITAFTVAVLLLSNIVQRVSGTLAFLANSYISSLIAALLIGFGVDPLRRWLMKVTDGFLFQQERQEQEILIQLSQRLSDMVLEEDVLDAVMKSIEQALRPSATSIYLFENGEDELLSITHTRKSGQKSLLRISKNELMTLITDLKQIKVGSQKLEDGVRAFLWPYRSNESARNEYSKAMPQGLLLLGPKCSGNLYTVEDEALLDAIFTQAHSALHKAKLYRGDRQKTEFVSIAAHELLTPIAAAEGYLSMLLDEHMGKLDQQAEGYLRKVYASTHRLRLLVKDLLSISRIEDGRTHFSPIGIRIEQSIADAIDQLQLVAREKGLQLIFNKPGEQLPLAFADPDKVTEVLINLIGNAIKYTPRGQVMISATSITEKGKPEIVVSVADTGLGMMRKAQVHLFEKFYRVSTPETATIQGTGLGLYITKTIVEKMGGRIWVESIRGKGSTFVFTLPYAKRNL